jgi:hypothetical protein
MLEKNNERANGRLATVSKRAQDTDEMEAIQPSAGPYYAVYFTRASLSLPHAALGSFV